MYQNVKKGLDLLYLQQILKIVEVILTIVTSLFAALTVGSALLLSSVLATLFGVLTGLFGVLLVIAAIADFVLGLLGILNASKDEILYKNALVWLVIGIAFTILGFFITDSSKFIWKLIRSIFDAAEGFCSFMVIYSVINATVNVAQAIGNVEVFSLGQQRANSFKTIYIVAIILKFLAFIPAIGGILDLAGSIIMIVIFVQYLGFLGKAKMMV